MAEAILRALRADERDLLRAATLGNLNWCGDRFTPDDVLTRPEFAHYTELVTERGDFGVVAVADATPLGVCWALFLPGSDPGYGFLDEGTPEVSLWVTPEARRQGLGRELVRAVVSEARSRGLRRLSLSVEADNHARTLYSSEGFTPVPGREDDGVMLLEL